MLVPNAPGVIKPAHPELTRQNITGYITQLQPCFQVIIDHVLSGKAVLPEAQQVSLAAQEERLIQCRLTEGPPPADPLGKHQPGTDTGVKGQFRYDLCK